MSLTPSQKIALGSTAPSFTLLDTTSGQQKSLSELQGKNGTVILFICNHCPYVIHVNATLVAMANAYQKQGIHFVAISSNDVENYPQDTPEMMTTVAKKEQYPFPYLYDETQSVAKAYGAECTPDIFLYDSDLKLYYHGQLDDSRPGNNIESKGSDIKVALNNLLENKSAPEIQKPSIGCNIKWK